MRSVEASIQHLIGAGFDPHLGRDPYRCFVYTSFQERATKVSHRNTARLAHEHGAASLRRACDAIAVRSAGACAKLACVWGRRAPARVRRHRGALCWRVRPTNNERI